mgnify:CR=1 FL=1
MEKSNNPPGRYYESFQEGEKLVTVSRTVTESDIQQFAGLSGDYNQLHTDRELAAVSVYGRKIAHGLLVVSIASGLAARTGFSDGTALALTKIDWKLRKPVFVGDTIKAELEVIRKKRVSKAAGGFVEFKVKVINQENTTVHRGTWTVMMKTKPQEG